MSAYMFERGPQLLDPLVQPGTRANGAAVAAEGVGEEPASLQESSSSLDSSRRTLNQAQGVTSGSHEFEAAVELSGGENMSYHLYQDRTGSLDKVEEEEEGEELNESHNELLIGDSFGSKLIVNHSGAYRTLPKPYNPATDSVVCRRDRNRSKWEEAALYVQEGEDDAKFYQHPDSRLSKIAYDTLHHYTYHILHLIICVLLLVLAFAESPAVGQDMLTSEDKKILISVHGVLELFFLSLLALDVFLKWVWLGGRHFVKHRTFLIGGNCRSPHACGREETVQLRETRPFHMSIVLVVMYMEALAVLIRQQNHIRITRLLRPLFLIDTYYMVGVRRVLRQIFKSFKPIIHVLFLLIFFIVLFAIFAYLIFAQADPDYFDTFARSLVSLFITQSTANNPDVMMESYSDNRATPIFFVVYIIITLYFASNVLLAVVYSTFSEADKQKFRKILCHKIDALTRAFRILSSDPLSETRQIQFHDFVHFMAHYKPRMPEWQVMCIFKALHKFPEDQYHGLNLEEFQRFYEVIHFKWEQVDTNGDKIPWFSKFSAPIRKPIQKLHTIVSHRAYKFVIGILVLINLIFFMAFISRIENNQERFSELHRVLPVSFVFLGIYMLDILLNIIGTGPSYFKKFWNLADVAVILFSFVCLCLELDPRYSSLAILRPLKFLRLVKVKRQYRDIMNTMVALAPRLLSIFFLILTIYYAFAIVGLECFSFKVSQGCCNESWYDVQMYYSGFVNASNSPNVYYLNNFNNILSSYVTLFILMVVNNWYIIMEGFASTVGERNRWLARLYFMAFYIITLVVLQVVIAFIVEAFVFKIQAAQRRRTCIKHPNDYDCSCKKDKKKTVTIALVEEDIAKLRYEVVYLQELMKTKKLTLNRLMKKFRRIDFSKMQHPVKFVGRRDHTKEDVHMLMYKDDIKSWVRTFKRQSRIGSTTKKPTFKEGAKRTGMTILNFLWD